MLDGAEAFNSAAAYVKREQGIPAIDLGTKLNSNTYIETCRSIENALNVLYEKTRTLEELRDYTKAYVKKQVEEKRNRIADRLKVIERAVDEYENKDYVAYNVPFEGNLEIVKDRDGTILPPMNDINGKLETGSTLLSNIPLQSAAAGSIQVEAELRNETFANLIQGKSARCIYETIKPVEGGINKEVVVTFKEASYVNCMTIKPVNCDIKEAYLMLQNGAQVPIDIKDSYITETLATGIKVIVNASNYEYAAKTVNSSREAYDNVWRSNYEGMKQ